MKGFLKGIGVAFLVFAASVAGIKIKESKCSMSNCNSFSVMGGIYCKKHAQIVNEEYEKKKKSEVPKKFRKTNKNYSNLGENNSSYLYNEYNSKSNAEASHHKKVNSTVHCL